MQVNIVDTAGKKTGAINLSDSVFDREFNQSLVHQIVTASLARMRQGTKAQKTRAEVAYSTVKVRQQKGSGRARAGSLKNPVWRHGGVIFAAKPRDYTQKVNKKMYRAGMAAILSEFLREARLQVIEPIQMDTPKTKALQQLLSGYGKGKILLIDENPSDALLLSARNLHYVGVCNALQLDSIDLMQADHVLMTAQAAEQLGERLQ